MLAQRGLRVGPNTPDAASQALDAAHSAAMAIRAAAQIPAVAAHAAFSSER